MYFPDLTSNYKNILKFNQFYKIIDFFLRKDIIFIYRGNMAIDWKLIHIIILDIMVCSGVLLIFVSSIIFFITHSKKFEVEYIDFPIDKKWIFLPVYTVHSLYSKFFGVGTYKIRDLFTSKSVVKTLSISLSANLICVFLILASIPKDFPKIEIHLISVLFF